MSETPVILPVWTHAVWPPIKPIVSVEEARNWLGIYGDDSIDNEVKACLDSAIEKIASNVGYRVSATEMTDHYPCFTGDDSVVFQLSEPGIDEETLVVKYYLETGTLSTLEATEYILDPSTEMPSVVIKEGRLPAGVSSTIKNPWQIEYTSKLEAVRGSPSIDRLKMGVRMALNWYWQDRGQTQQVRLLDNSLYSLLASCRRRRQNNE